MTPTQMLADADTEIDTDIGERLLGLIPLIRVTVFGTIGGAVFLYQKSGLSVMKQL